MVEPSLAALALEQVAGAAILLDHKLKVAATTGRAEAILGAPIPLGAPAAQLLCGEAPVRPVAEALAEGRAVTARVSRPDRGGERLIEVRATPLGAPEGKPAPIGFLLELSEVEASGDGEGGATLFHGMWTRHPAMRALFASAERVGPTESTVLVRGETGTGKELLARALHELSSRAGGPFHALNCAALSPTLLESELFGHQRGAFTGAIKDAPGHFRLASGGTLFLDEVAELPFELQAKLLRAIQTKAVIPVGGTEARPVDVRIISATHRGLRAEVDAGRFRADLMYRLRVVPLYIPALRERGDDVLLLAERIRERLAARPRARKVERISKAARRVLLGYTWPGNVRELENALEYAVVIGSGPVLEPKDLPPEITHPEQQGPIPTNVPAPISETDPERARILRALERAGGNRERAARMLGISRVTLWRRLASGPTAPPPRGPRPPRSTPRGSGSR
jgi:transcriptional regulator with PAS, ATPase and Fis domain